MIFEKKITENECKILLHDLESMELNLTNNEFNLYHYNLLRQNIKDLGGIQ